MSNIVHLNPSNQCKVADRIRILQLYESGQTTKKERDEFLRVGGHAPYRERLVTEVIYLPKEVKKIEVRQDINHHALDSVAYSSSSFRPDWINFSDTIQSKIEPQYNPNDYLMSLSFLMALLVAQEENK